MRVGLTGGVASGKSTVSAILAELGRRRDRRRPARPRGGRAGYRRAGRRGRGVRPRRARPRRRARPPAPRCPGLRRPRAPARARGDHPPARPCPRRRDRGGRPLGSVVVHDIPLLAETGQAASFDAVVVVDVPPEVQVDRMVRIRGMSEEDARARSRPRRRARSGWRSRRTSWTTPAASRTCGRGSRRSTDCSSGLASGLVRAYAPRVTRGHSRTVVASRPPALVARRSGSTDATGLLRRGVVDLHPARRSVPG